MTQYFKKSKNFLALLLAFLVAFTMMPVQSFAAAAKTVTWGGTVVANSAGTGLTSTLKATLTGGETFAVKGKNLTKTTHFTIGNPISGITPVIKTSADGKSATVSFTVTSAAKRVDSKSLDITFTAKAFKGGKTITGNKKSDIQITFVTVKSAVAAPTSVVAGTKTVVTVTGVNLPTTTKVDIYKGTTKLDATKVTVAKISGATAKSVKFNVTPKNTAAAGTYTAKVYVGSALKKSVNFTVKAATKYKVTYNKNNTAATGTVPADATGYLKGTQATVKAVGSLVLKDHAFQGWATNAAGTGTVYKAGTKVTVNANMTLYAVWKKTTVAVTGVTVTPATTEFLASDATTVRKEISATVAPTTATDKKVKWTITGTDVANFELYDAETAGTVVALGTETSVVKVYVAPKAALTAAMTATVTATSVADATKKDTSVVSVAVAKTEITKVTYNPITAPVTNAVPAATYTPVTGETSYTAAISWDGAPATFAAETAYKATVVLTAVNGFKFKEGFALADVTDLTVAAPITAATVTTAADGSTATIAVTFAKTGSAGPEVSTAAAVSSTKVKVTFNKTLESVVPANFDVKVQTSGVLVPILAATLAADAKSVTLDLANSLTKNINYDLVAKNITAVDKTVLVSATKTFVYDFGAPTSIAFTTTTLPKAAEVDLKDYVEVKDAKGNILVDGVEIVFTSTAQLSSGSIIDLTGSGPFIVTATIKDTTITTGQKTISAQAVKIAEITKFTLRKDSRDLTQASVGTTGVTPYLEGIDQFGNKVENAAFTGVTFSSSNQGLVTINASNGTPTFIASGTVILSASVNSGAVVKSLSFTVNAKPTVASLEAPTTISVTGASSAPRTALKIKTLDQYGEAISGAVVTYTSTSPVVEVYKVPLYDTPAASGTITTGSTGEATVYVQGKSEGTASINFKITSGTTTIEKNVTVTSNAAGSAEKWLIEVTDDTISLSVGSTDTTATIKVYEADANDNKIKDVSTDASITYHVPVSGSLIQPTTANKNVFEPISPAPATRTGETVVTVKTGTTFVIGTATIKTVESTITPKSVTLENTNIPLINLSDIAMFEKENIAKNFIFTMSDNSVLNNTTDPVGTDRAHLIDTIISSNEKIVSVSSTGVAAGGKADGALNLTNGTAAITVLFKEPTLANQTFNVSIGNVRIAENTSVNTNAGALSASVVKGLTIGADVKVSIPLNKTLTLVSDITNNGTIENNGAIEQGAASGTPVQIISTGTGNISGEGKIVTGRAGGSNQIILVGNHVIAEGAKQTVEAGGVQSGLFVKDAADATKSSLTNNGTLTITNTNAVPAQLSVEKGSIVNNYIINVIGTKGINNVSAAQLVANGAKASGATPANAKIINNNSGVINLQTTGSEANNQAIIHAGGGEITNKGIINLNANSVSGATNGEARINQYATCDIINEGSINLKGAADGLMLGAGSVLTNRGTIDNKGHVDLDTNVGTKLAFEANGSLVLEIGGRITDDDTDELLVATEAPVTFVKKSTATISSMTPTNTAKNVKLTGLDVNFASSAVLTAKVAATTITVQDVVMKSAGVPVATFSSTTATAGSTILTGAAATAVITASPNTLTLTDTTATATLTVPANEVMTIASGSTFVVGDATAAATDATISVIGTITNNGTVSVLGTVAGTSAATGVLNLESGAALSVGADGVLGTSAQLGYLKIQTKTAANTITAVNTAKVFVTLVGVSTITTVPTKGLTGSSSANASTITGTANADVTITPAATSAASAAAGTIA